MKLIKIPLLLIWRCWFYILICTTILLMSPFLMILTARESYYPAFWKLIRAWAYVLVYGMGFRIDKKLDEVIDSGKNYVFCPNHGSMMDPFVLIILSKNPIVFIGKRELIKIPIFGFFYKRVVIMVDRSNPVSRKKVYKKAKKRLKTGVSIGVFPEGLVPKEDVILAPFKNGAFSLAIEHQIPIVPQTYFDCKRLFSWDIFKGGTGTLRVHQHSFIETKGLMPRDLNKLKDKTFQVIYDALSLDPLYMRDTTRNK